MPMTINTKKLFIAGAVAIFVVVLFQIFFEIVVKQGAASETYSPQHDWVVSYKSGGFTYNGLSAVQKNNVVLQRGDSIFVQNELPPGHPLVVRFLAYHKLIEIYQDDIMLYSYGKSDFEKGTLVGSGYHYFYPMVCDTNCDVRFVFVESENDMPLYAPKFELLTPWEANSDFNATRFSSLVFGLFLVVFGALSAIIGACASIYGASYFRLLMIGLLSFSLGLWTLCYTKLVQIFSMNLAFNTSLEYVSLLFSAIPFSFLLVRMRKGKILRWKWYVLIGINAIGILVFVALSTLHFMDIVHFSRTLWIYHIYVGLAVIALIACGAIYNRRMDKSGKIFAVGCFVFVGFAMLELVRYKINQTEMFGHILSDNSLLPMGTFFFVLLLMVSFVVHLSRLQSHKAERDLLANIAYLDSLTGLFNRAKCKQIFEVLDRGNSDYAIVSIDLNGLKYVNDNYGHGMGDALIKAFAQALKEAFDGIGTAIRLGGDEFIMVVRSEHLAEMDLALAKMAKLQKKRGAELPVPLEAAYGIAFRHELADKYSAEQRNGRFESEYVYDLADERMYAMKSEMKSNLVRK
jgi:diguanylate cyclase (GGDEF)-like protein